MTKAYPFYIGSDTSKKLYPQLLVLVLLDVEYRRLMRMVVGPPTDTN